MFYGLQGKRILITASTAGMGLANARIFAKFTKDNIRLNIVSPGTIDTAFHDGKNDELKSNIANNIPNGTLWQYRRSRSYFCFLCVTRL